MTARVARLHLNVADLGRASRFYTQVLGFRDTLEDGAVVLESDGGGPDIVLHQVTPSITPSPLCLGVGAVAFEVSGRESLSALSERLAASGARVSLTTRPGAPALFTTDPDGNRLEIFAPAVERNANSPVPGFQFPVSSRSGRLESENLQNPRT